MGRPLVAQQRSALDVGIAVVHFPDDSSTVGGPSVAWTSVVERQHLFGLLNAGGVGSIGGASGSLTASGGARTPIASHLLVEGGGEWFGIASSSTSESVAAIASARLVAPFTHGGAWLRGTASDSWREAGSLPGQSLEGGVWWELPRARLSASLLNQHAHAQLFAAPWRGQLIGKIPVHYTEGAIGAHVESDAVSLDLLGGVRRDPDAEHLYEPIVVATAAFWTGETRAWTVSLSKLPNDFVRGADAASWLAVGMRFFESTPARSRAERARPILLVNGTGEERVLIVRASGARTVEIMADFTGWAPVALTAGALGFERAFTLSTGTHRVVVRIDGGPWRPATNTPAVDDDLGGRVGLLVVP
ncbi:MAG TPA: glycogen-binding domain-containing protein [Gemmatimonadaceae bacterium]